MFIIDYVLEKFGYVRKPVPAPWPFPAEKPVKKVAHKVVVKKVTARKK
jgi:hypothetical protein